MAETTPRKADSHIVPLYIRAADRIPMTELADQTHADLETRRRRARFRAWPQEMTPRAPRGGPRVRFLVTDIAGIRLTS